MLFLMPEIPLFLTENYPAQNIPRCLINLPSLLIWHSEKALVERHHIFTDVDPNILIEFHRSSTFSYIICAKLYTLLLIGGLSPPEHWLCLSVSGKCVTVVHQCIINKLCSSAVHWTANKTTNTRLNSVFIWFEIHHNGRRIPNTTRNVCPDKVQPLHRGNFSTRRPTVSQSVNNAMSESVRRSNYKHTNPLTGNQYRNAHQRRYPTAPFWICSGNRMHWKGNWQFSIQLSSQPETCEFCCTMWKQLFHWPLCFAMIKDGDAVDFLNIRVKVAFNYTEKYHLLCHQKYLFVTPVRLTLQTYPAAKCNDRTERVDDIVGSLNKPFKEIKLLLKRRRVIKTWKYDPHFL